MVFWTATTGVSFRDTVEIVDFDNVVTLRRMNVDGSIYGKEVVYDDDSNSLDLGRMESDEDGLAFLDAVEDNLETDHLQGKR
jgi:hypothetical protein